MCYCMSSLSFSFLVTNETDSRDLQRDSPRIAEMGGPHLTSPPEQWPENPYSLDLVGCSRDRAAGL